LQIIHHFDRASIVQHALMYTHGAGFIALLDVGGRDDGRVEGGDGFSSTDSGSSVAAARGPYLYLDN